MTRRSRGTGRRTAIVAALLLAAQALLLAFSLGAGAEPLPRDRFGNVLCATDASGSHRTPDGGDRHGGRLDCCTAACPMLGGALPPALAALPAASWEAALRLPFAVHENAAGAGVPSSPRSARAPPFSA